MGSTMCPRISSRCNRMIRRALICCLLAAVSAFAEPEATPVSAAASPEPKAMPAGEKMPARPEGKIWSGLVYATNAGTPKEPPAELRDFAARLRRVFGYNQFQLAGSAVNAIDDDGESWLVPSKTFSLNVRARPAPSKEARGGYLINLQLFQGTRQLVDTEAKLAPGSPLFIRGPACGSGHLIIVLQVQR